MLSSELTKLTNVKQILDKESINLKYSLGQNFLINYKIIEHIIQLADVKSDDQILEVGCGIGCLTCALLEAGARVSCVEKDDRLYDLISDITIDYKDKFILVKKDALDLREDDIAVKPNKFVANLPYSIAATLVLDYFDKFKNLKTTTVMVQKEVAQRMMAKSNTKLYGAYSVKLQLRADLEDFFYVGRNNFYPAPRVDSAVVKLVRTKRDLSEEVTNHASKAADAAFFNRRKTILNSFVAYFGKDRQQQIGLLFESCHINPTSRGEALGIEKYILLGQKWSEFMQ